MWRGVLKSGWRLSRGNVLLGRFGGPLILSFHRVIRSEVAAEGFLNTRVGAVSPALLQDVLQLLAACGYEFVPLAELLAGRQRGRRVASLTFDDGFRDVLDVAVPILRRHRCPATLFLITSTLGARELLWQHRLYIAWPLAPARARRDLLSNALAHRTDTNDSDERQLSILMKTGVPSVLHQFSLDLAEAACVHRAQEEQLCGSLYMTPAEVERLVDEGVAVGGHGHCHWRASSQSPEEMERDLRACAEVLRSVAMASAFDFGIPHGDTGKGIAGRAVQAGFRYVLDSVRVTAPVECEWPERLWFWDNLNDANAMLTRLWARQIVHSA